MLSSYLSMQNAMIENNMAAMQMANAADRMGSLAINNSQPLRPSFNAALLNSELCIKANETKVTVTQKLIEALNKKLGKDINNSTPKYAGIDVKA